MHQPYRGSIREIACLFAHTAPAEEDGNRICGLAVAAALRSYPSRSDTPFGNLFVHLNARYRDYFGGLFDPSAGGETSDWNRFLEKSPHPEALSGTLEDKQAWLARVSELLPGLIRRNRDRPLVLFASHGDIEAVSQKVADEIRADVYPLLIQQNGAPTADLCDEFRTIRESVLSGVDTFWHEVDFPGKPLTHVIITRIPFSHRHCPLQITRRNLLPREEYWRCHHYETEIKLRQGIGRLICSKADRGGAVILDARYRGRTPQGGLL